MNLKTGTRIEVIVTHPLGTNEMATIARWPKACGPRDGRISPMNGWHVIKFANGGKLCIHESGFRVVDNRKGYGPQ